VSVHTKQRVIIYDMMNLFLSLHTHTFLQTLTLTHTPTHTPRLTHTYRYIKAGAHANDLFAENFAYAKTRPAKSAKIFIITIMITTRTTTNYEYTYQAV